MGGGLKREGIYIYIVMADSHCCMAETNNVAQQLSSKKVIKICRMYYAV